MIPAAEQLRSLCRVYAVDLPGYGRSYKPGAVLNLLQLADALAQWLEASRISKAHFVGNSFGCQVLAEFAVRHPQYVDRLVFQGPTIDPMARSLRAQLVRLLINSRREQRSMGWITIADYGSTGARRAWATVKLALSDKIEDKLPRIEVPVLVVRGERDAVVPQRWAEEVTRLLPKGQLHVIPQGAHTVNYSLPKEFAAAIIPFLELR
jgi:2-hydroxy-6-oxonona-2,4-dienedioate hydrolase